MKKIQPLSAALLLGLALTLAACGSSKSTNNAPSTPTVGTTATTVPPGGGTAPCTIPQNNGGDHDADNNGGPDDGDGCDR